MPQRVSKIRTIGNRSGKQLLSSFATVLLLALLGTPTIAGESVKAPFTSLEEAVGAGEGPVDDRHLATICGKGLQEDNAIKVSTSVILWDEVGGRGSRRRDVYQRAEVPGSAPEVSLTFRSD